MRYHALATDYDGTLAHDGTVDPDTLDALRLLRASGRKIVLVTGRELPELLSVFHHIDLFDRVVAENGAVLYRPATREQRLLAPKPPPELGKELRRRGVSRISEGEVVIATWRPHEIKVFEVLRDLEIESQIIFNKDAVMVLPSGVNKASGLWAALAEIGLSPHNVVGVGDAENDQSFLRLCECAVAVANALPSVKQSSDLVTSGQRGHGVTELIHELVNDDLAAVENLLQRHEIRLGVTSTNTVVGLNPHGSRVLVSGDSGSGKSTLTTGLLERMGDAGYQYCLLDPEGEYRHLPDAVVLGSSQRMPSVGEIMELLERPSQNAVVNLLGAAVEHRPAHFDSLLPSLIERRTRSGRPHWVVLDEAQYVLPSSWAPILHTAPQELQGLMLISAYPERIDARVLKSVKLVLVTGHNAEQILHRICRTMGDPLPLVPALPEKLRSCHNLCLAWWRSSGGDPMWLRAISPRGEHHRHLRKYVEGELRPDICFYFRGPEGKLNLRAQNLAMFLHLTDGVDEATWRYHLRRHDYSRWFREAIRDPSLAGEAERVESDRGIPSYLARQLIREMIQQRYTGTT